MLSKEFLRLIAVMTALVAWSATTLWAVASDEVTPPSSKQGASADSEEPKEVDPTAEKPAAEAADDEENVERDAKLSRDVLERDGESEIERLERAIAGMRTARDRLATADSGKETQDIQERVIKDLEKLVEFLSQQQQNQQQNQKNDPRQAQQKDQQKNRQKNQKQDKISQPPKPQNDPMKSGKDQQSDDKSRTSQERLNPRPIPAEERARRERMVKDVWGHLPPQLRDAMAKHFTEKYLPQYEDLVKKYYESLAEKSSKRGGK